jgi:hypothetical protein
VSNLLQFVLLLLVFIQEALYTAFSIKQFTFARKEGVTTGADFDFDIISRSASLDDVATSTANCGFIILRVNTLFHSEFLLTDLDPTVKKLMINRSFLLRILHSFWYEQPCLVKTPSHRPCS